MTTDTITMLPSSRPVPPTTELLLPLKPPAVAHYTVKRPWWIRNSPPRGSDRFIWGVIIAAALPFSYAVADVLTGGAL